MSFFGIARLLAVDVTYWVSVLHACLWLLDSDYWTELTMEGP